MQITRRAKFHKVFGPDEVMKYFKDTIVPEVSARQLSHESTIDVAGMNKLIQCLIEALPTGKKYRVRQQCIYTDHRL